MDSIVIACETLKDELNVAVNILIMTAYYLIDSKYHLDPGGLRKNFNKK